MPGNPQNRKTKHSTIWANLSFCAMTSAESITVQLLSQNSNWKFLPQHLQLIHKCYTSYTNALIQTILSTAILQPVDKHHTFNCTVTRKKEANGILYKPQQIQMHCYHFWQARSQTLCKNINTEYWYTSAINATILPCKLKTQTTSKGQIARKQLLIQSFTSCSEYWEKRYTKYTLPTWTS